MKKNSAKRKLIPAAAMLCISAAMLATSTYAWFTMNREVTATGMKVQAKAEGGLLITNEKFNDWSNSATALYNSTAKLIPTSTANATDWYHSTSDRFDNANASQAAEKYVKVSVDTNWKNKDGVQYIDTDKDDNLGNSESAYYLLNKFYIKSSGDAIGTAEAPSGLKIKSVTASGSSTSPDLDSSLRVAVVVNGTPHIYAPVNGATLSYKVGGSDKEDTTVTDSTNSAATALNTNLNVATIPPVTINQKNDAVEADVYLYFEGEDALCKSSKITSTLDTLQVTVVFGID